MLDVFTPLYDELVRAGRVREVPMSVFCHLISAGGGAPFSHSVISERLFDDVPSTADEIERHAQAVADLIFDGLRRPGTGERP